MIDSLPPLTLRRRDIRFSAYRFEWAHPSVLDDAPVLDSQRRYVADLLVREAATWDPPHVVDPALVETMVLTPDDLVETVEWMNDQRAEVTINGEVHVMGDEMEPPPFRIGAVVAYERLTKDSGE